MRRLSPTGRSILRISDSCQLDCSSPAAFTHSSSPSATFSPSAFPERRDNLRHVYTLISYAALRGLVCNAPNPREVVAAAVAVLCSLSLLTTGPPTPTAEYPRIWVRPTLFSSVPIASYVPIDRQMRDLRFSRVSATFPNPQVPRDAR